MHRRDERGLSESVQWAVLTPLVLFVLLAAVQVGLVWHGRVTVREAAAAAAERESTYQAPVGSGRPVAERVLAAGGVTTVAVHSRRAVDRVEVSVTGRVPGVVDWGSATIRETAVAPKERVR